MSFHLIKKSLSIVRLRSSSSLNGLAPIKPLYHVDLDKYSLKQYMSDTQTQLAKNLLVTTTTCAGAIGLSTMGLPPSILMGGWIGSALLGFGSCFEINKYSPLVRDNKITDDPKRKMWSNILFGTQGVIIAPLVFMSMDVVPEALVITSSLTLGTITSSFYLPKDIMLQYGSALYTCLWGLIGMGIMGIWLPALHSIEPYIGIGLFSLYNMYDTHVLIKSYEKKEIDPMLHAVNYGLNFINMFIRVLEILAKSKK